MRIKPGQFVMVKSSEGEDPLPAEIQQIRFVDTKNGSSAVAVVIEIGEMPMPRVLELVVNQGDFEDYVTKEQISTVDFDCPEALSMADPQIVASIQKRLADQREHMRLAIQASLQAPREMSFGGARGSAASKEKQRARAKEQRAQQSTLRENAISAVMAEKGCTKEEALKFFEDMAKQRGY